MNGQIQQEKIKVQNLIFPGNDKGEYKPKLFYRGTSLVEDKEHSFCGISAYAKIDFATYFNSFSLGKWKEYTEMQNLDLELTAVGDFRVKLVGYLIEDGILQQVALGDYRVNHETERTVSFSYDKSDAAIVAFEIYTYSECRILKGGYVISVPAEGVRDITLALATTTFKQEEYIISNIKAIEKDILGADDPIARNFHVFVIDNGRTLRSDEFTSPAIEVIPNDNAGGSGGFCRGMMCAIDMEPQPTHLLLMDDDVLIIPESIKRTYFLLKCLKPEYQSSFISGAMLSYEKIDVQEEDAGYINREGWFTPVKHPLFLESVYDLVKNEAGDWEKHDYQYAPWWYCCIPMNFISNQNLPLPLFVRGDDAEFSVRNHCGIISMNSIGIWHKGFASKHFASKEYYQVFRNSLISQAICGEFDDVNFMARLKKYFMTEINRFNYIAANQICDALEDYLKGPELICTNNGAELMKNEGAKNEKLVPVSEFPIAVDYDKLYEFIPRTFMQKVISKLTVNGHYLPAFLLKKEPGVIPFDLYTWFPEKAYRRKAVLAVNELEKTAAYRELNRAEFKKTMRRWKSLNQRYKTEGEQIKGAYRQKRAEFTSREFWNRYLNLGENQQ